MENLRKIGFRRKLFIHCVRVSEKFLMKYSKFGVGPFFDNANFDWVPNVEKNIPVMQEELGEIILRMQDLPNFQDISVEQNNITRDQNWKIFPFFAYGNSNVDLENTCPKTMRIIKDIPGIKTAMYSILMPNKYIPPHRGPYRGLLRLHIPLRIPEDFMNCKIQVNNETRNWEEGKCLIFDDGFIHQVWNNTSEIRVVLFIDFLRPLNFPWNQINILIFKMYAKSSFIQNAIKNARQWSRKIWLRNDKIFNL